MARPSPLTTTVRIADSLPRRHRRESRPDGRTRTVRQNAAERVGQARTAGLGEPQCAARAPTLEPAQVEQPAADRGTERAVQVRTALRPVQARTREGSPCAAEGLKIYPERGKRQRAILCHLELRREA